MTSNAALRRAIDIASAIEEVVRESTPASRFLDVYPRDMAAIVGTGFGVAVRYQPNLTVASAHSYIHRLRGRAEGPRGYPTDRRVYGLLHVGPPCNLIMISRELKGAAANHVIAHEMGHYFADVLRVRRRWLDSLSDRRADVMRAFDWRSHAGELELAAVVKGLPPLPHQIVDRGRAQRPETVERELLADLVARQLLAPWRLVAQQVVNRGTQAAISWLQKDYGLLPIPATDYEADVRWRLGPKTDLVERLWPADAGSGAGRDGELDQVHEEAHSRPYDWYEIGELRRNLTDRSP